MPLTACAAACAMHAALEPGEAAPLVPLMSRVTPSHWSSWSGHRCRSGFVSSSAEASTVSFDFRVIPWSIYREDRAAAKRSNHSLRLGGYYAVMERAGVQGGQGASEPSEHRWHVVI